MRLLSTTLLAAFYVFLISPGSVSAEDKHPDKAVCQVCAEKGETHGPEKVKGISTYEEISYYFCSKNCKEAFDTDPAGYLLQVFPRPAPGLNAKDFEGVAPTLDEYTNSVVLLDFWATWCKPCVAIMPKLQELQDTYGDKGFHVLGISIDEDAIKVTKFVSKRNIDYRIAIDDQESPTWEAYKVKALPTSFLIGRDGQIAARWVGKPDLDEVRAAISKSLEQDSPGD